MATTNGKTKRGRPRGSKHKLNSIILPVENDLLEEYILENKRQLMLHVVSAIEVGIKKNLEFIEVFKFEDTNFIVTISKQDYNENLNFLYEQFINLEFYEDCDRIIKVKEILEEKVL